MAVPLPVQSQPLVDVPTLPLYVEAFFEPPPTYINFYFFGTSRLTSYGVIYTDLRDFVWWGLVTRACVESIGAVVMGRDGSVVDRVVPGSGTGTILPGTEWTLENSPADFIGGCLTATLVSSRPLNVAPRALIAFDLVDTAQETQRVYLGRADKPPMNTQVRDPDTGELVDSFSYHLIGPKSFAADLYLLGVEYTQMDIGAIIRDIVENHLAAKSPVRYNSTKIPDTGYTVKHQSFQNVTILSALDTLTQLAGEYTWGVDITGEAFLAPRQTASEHHFWLDRHRVTLNNLVRSTDNIRNAIYVETSTDSGGARIYHAVEDADSIASWGRVEEVVQLPSSVVDFDVATITSITSNELITDEENMRDGNASTFGTVEIGTIPDTYIDVNLPATVPITGIEFRQARRDGTARAIIVEDADGNELVFAQQLGARFTVSLPLTYGNRLRIRPVEIEDPEWVIHEIIVRVGDLSDPERYALSLLRLWKEPVLQGELLIEDGCFITPTGIRLTDVRGGSYEFEVARMTYRLEPGGLHIRASVGRGHLNLERALSLTSKRVDAVSETQRNERSQDSVIVQPIVNLDEFLLGAANLGLGAQVFSHEAEQQLHFRSLQSTDNSIQIDQQTNTIDLRVAESSPIPVILDDLSDVDVGGATHGQALLWNDAAQMWEADDLPTPPAQVIPQVFYDGELHDYLELEAGEGIVFTLIGNRLIISKDEGGS